jgi:hypothetical protein
MPDMASPDRLVFVDGQSLDYSDPNQVTVRSSWWSNRFFGTETDRDEYLQRLSQPYLNADNNLDFQGILADYHRGGVEGRTDIDLEKVTSYKQCHNICLPHQFPCLYLRWSVNEYTDKIYLNNLKFLC